MPKFDQKSISIRSLAFQNAGPICIIDLDGRLVDWNLTFDEVIAKPLHLCMGQDVGDSGDLFSVALPWHDLDSSTCRQAKTERILIDLPPFGNSEFQCLLSQVITANGEPCAWTVSLSPMNSKVQSEIWTHLALRLDREVTWSKYAAVYDSLLLNFPAYRSLMRQVSAEVTGCRHCADLGTGTGNSAIQLLEDECERTVVAIDSNDFMLQCFQSKISERFKHRLQIRKDDIEQMPFLDDQTFDAVTLVNSLYAVNNPGACLREVHRILKADGRLVLTTPHSETDVGRLLNELRKSLLDQGLFDTFADAYKAAEERHASLSQQIHRFTVEQTNAMLESCGFTIKSNTNAYVDAVILIVAEKKMKTTTTELVFSNEK